MSAPLPRLGAYRLVGRLSSGGMAEVFRALARGADGKDRFVAVKRIRPELADDKEFVAMLLDEARLSSRLNHENIAGVVDLGHDSDNLYLVLEYVAGPDLSTLTRKLRADNRRMDAALACHVVASVLEALAHAHDARDAAGAPMEIVHRDLSPSNVLVSYDGDVKLIDFGIARASVRLTRTAIGVIKGKARYMSPEQARERKLDARSDIYSTGILLHELLTGERLYAGDSDVDILRKVVQADVPSLRGRPDIPEEVLPLLERATARAPEKRFQHAAPFAKALRQVATDLAPLDTPKDLVRRLVRGTFQKEYEEEHRLAAEYLPHTAAQRAPGADPDRTIPASAKVVETATEPEVAVFSSGPAQLPDKTDKNANVDSSLPTIPSVSITRSQDEDPRSARATAIVVIVLMVLALAAVWWSGALSGSSRRDGPRPASIRDVAPDRR